MARKLYKYKGPRCGKMIKCKLSKDLVPCDGDSGHKGRHTPSLSEKTKIFQRGIFGGMTRIG